MAVDLQELLLGEQAACLAALARNSIENGNRLAKIADKKFDEIDPLQAAAIKELGKAGENPRYQPQTAPAAA